jgi:murein DD-endopeptidase MepM/ murein hydrolase activator NlpD
MRFTTPLMVILLAVLVYAGRDQLLAPLVEQPRQVMAPATGERVDVPAIVPAGIAPPETQSGARRATPKRGKIRRNSSLYIELTKMGVSPQEVHGVARASKKTYNLKRVQPGQRFSVYQSSTGELDSLEFVINAEQHLKVRREGEKYTSEIEHIPYEVTYHVTQGVINSSIFAALKKQGAETELASGLDEIFGWTIDFFSDVRKGDSFAILYERKQFEDGRTTLGDILSARVVNKGEEHWAVRFTPEGKPVGYYDLEGNSLQKSLRRSPLKFTRVTSNFTNRRFHPVYKTYRPHYGVDYGAPRGTPVYSTGDGTILVAGRRRGNGNYVKIKHTNTYTTYYLHLNGFARGIRSGIKVRQGQLIGYVGSTGAATASHVCYRIKRNGSWVNPKRLKLPSKAPVPQAQIASYNRVRDTFLFRVQESLLAGNDNGTTAVPEPTYPSRQAQTLF